MPDALAIDIVLLPDPPTNDWLISLSQKLPINNLNRTDRLAHLTLSHGHVRTTAIDEIAQSLEDVAATTRSLSLTVTQMTSKFRDHIGLWNYWPSVELTPELRSAVSAAHAIIRPYLVELPEGEVAYVLDPNESPVTGGLFEFSQQFLKNFSFEQYDPHFTIGYGPEQAFDQQPHRLVSVDRLALCQLGTEGTCRKILAEWPLEETA